MRGRGSTVSPIDPNKRTIGAPLRVVQYRVSSCCGSVAVDAAHKGGFVPITRHTEMIAMKVYPGQLVAFALFAAVFSGVGIVHAQAQTCSYSPMGPIHDGVYTTKGEAYAACIAGTSGRWNIGGYARDFVSCADQSPDIKRFHQLWVIVHVNGYCDNKMNAGLVSNFATFYWQQSCEAGTAWNEGAQQCIAIPPAFDPGKNNQCDIPMASVAPSDSVPSSYSRARTSSLGRA